MKRSTKIILVIIVLIVILLFVYNQFSNKSIIDINENQINHSNLSSSLDNLKNNLIPYLNYTCENIFPDEVDIDIISNHYSKTNYKNNIKIIAKCQPQSNTGGNINIYECYSGFYIEQKYLPDGTIVDKHYHVKYSFTLDKRECQDDKCFPKSIACDFDNTATPSLGDSDYLKYYDQPIVYLNGTCQGCVALDGGCVSVDTYFEGVYCHA